MPGKTKNPSIQERLKQNIQFLDALLADLQATNPSASTTSPPRSDSPPPPLPPPPSFEALDPNGRERNGEDIFSQRDHSLSLNANLSELDSLLEDLSSPMSFGTTSESSGKPAFLYSM